MESNTADELRQGNPRALTLVVQRYGKSIYSYFLKKTRYPEFAEELTNDTFNRLWTYRKKIVDIQTIEAYLWSLAQSNFQNWLTKSEREKKQMADYSEDYRRNDEQTGGEDTLNARMDMAIIVDRLNLILPEKCCQVFLLSRMHDMSYEEIAEKLSISKDTVRNHLIRAKKLLSGLGSLWNYP